MLTELLSPLLLCAKQLRIRLPVIYQGNEVPLLARTHKLLQQYSAQRIYWLGANAPEHCIVLTEQRHFPLLGSECDVLVINAFSGFPADLVAASAGCLKAGGLWLLLCPPFAEWATLPNPAHKKLLSYPLDASQHQGNFTAFWIAQLQQSNCLHLSEQGICQQLTWPVAGTEHPVTAPYATEHQQQAVQAILNVVSGHRRRPLVLTADRGRGKSAALGIAAAQLFKQNKQQLIITAPTPETAGTALWHFQQSVPATAHSVLRFVPVDELLLTLPATDLLLVDEAAAIPTPQLKRLLQHYSRIVFASTEHGYEGTGRGFQLRFQHYLQQNAPGWRKLHLQQPVRYQQNDPLEQLIFNSFLLNSELPKITSAPSQAVVNCYQADDWLQQPQKLRQVFSLLCFAHYQTQVTDLAALLDNPKLVVYTLEQQGQLLACALISYEGELQQTLAQQIYQGERRVQGHLLAQSLAFHLAQPELATLALPRLMRIAVHPACQLQGWGSYLIRQIATDLKQQNYPFWGTSFGATAGLLHFWYKAGFQPVRLGITADKASGEHSLLMLAALNSHHGIIGQLQQAFATNLYLELAENYHTLAAELALQLVRVPNDPLTEHDKQLLTLFAQGKRPYELVSSLLLRWFNLHYQQLDHDNPDVNMLCARLWQKQPWPVLAAKFKLTGKAEIIKNFQKVVSDSTA